MPDGSRAGGSPEVTDVEPLSTVALLRLVIASIDPPKMPPHRSWCTGIEDWGLPDARHCACGRSIERERVMNARTALAAAREMLESADAQA